MYSSGFDAGVVRDKCSFRSSFSDERSNCGHLEAVNIQFDRSTCRYDEAAAAKYREALICGRLARSTSDYTVKMASLRQTIRLEDE